MRHRGSGLGWCLTLTDRICHEYGWRLDEVMNEIPLAQVFALFAAIAVRREQPLPGPSYADQDILDRIERARHQGATP